MINWSKSRLRSWSQTVIGQEPKRIDDYSNIINEIGNASNGSLLRNSEFIGARSLFVGSLRYSLALQLSSPTGCVLQSIVAKRGVASSSNLGTRYLIDRNYVGHLEAGVHYFDGYEENIYFTSIALFCFGSLSNYRINIQYDGSLLYYNHDIFEKFLDSDYPQRFFASSV